LRGQHTTGNALAAMNAKSAVLRLLKPACLQPGDVIGIIAPASPPPDPKAVDRAIGQVEWLGFKPKLGRHVRARHGFLAGSDRDRAGDLMRMFLDVRVKGIICLRGGYGTARLLERLDYAAIRQNPKVFAGYSDITGLHCALLKKAGLVTFHSPMLNEGLGRPDFPKFSVGSFLRTVMEASPAGSIVSGFEEASQIDIVRRGVASGRLIGGNLSVLVTTLGTPYQPELRGRVLFLEDVNEAPYKIDRMLTQLLNAGVLQQVAGVAVGVNRDCMDPLATKTSEYRQSVDDVMHERLKPLGVPVVLGLPFGHQRHNATLPIGVRATLDANKGDLIVKESAVVGREA
jgi:muramoyltetrapeptide carboxypeptidase